MGLAILKLMPDRVFDWMMRRAGPRPWSWISDRSQTLVETIMSSNRTATASPASISELARCIECGTPLLGHDRCPGAIGLIDTRDGIIQAIGPLRGRNRIVAAFLRWSGLDPLSQVGTHCS